MTCCVHPTPSPHREQETIPSVLEFIHYSSKARDTLKKLKQFMKDHVYPVELVRDNLSTNSTLLTLIIDHFHISAVVPCTCTVRGKAIRSVYVCMSIYIATAQTTMKLIAKLWTMLQESPIHFHFMCTCSHIMEVRQRVNK